MSDIAGIDYVQVPTTLNQKFRIPIFKINANKSSGTETIWIGRYDFEASLVYSNVGNSYASSKCPIRNVSGLRVYIAGGESIQNGANFSTNSNNTNSTVYVGLGSSNIASSRGYTRYCVSLAIVKWLDTTAAFLMALTAETASTIQECTDSNYGYLVNVAVPNSSKSLIVMSVQQNNIDLANQLMSYYSPDPYGNVPSTGPGGGDSDYDPFSTDDIDYELLPEVSAVGTGFMSLWCPTEQQMLDLSEYMWNADIFTLDFWRKLVADPIQLVYGLNIIPLDLRDAGIVGDDPEDVVVGAISTGIKMDYLTSQWVELDCGTIDIEENMLGSYLDYDPFTKVDIYLPYIGYRPLRIDDIMPGTIQLKYRIDLLTGACVAQIKSTKTSLHDDTLNSIVYQFMGNCATQVPVTASQYADAVRAAISIAAAIGTVAALAGTGAGAGAGAAMGAEIMPGVDPAGYISAPSMVPVDSELGMNMAAYNHMTSMPPAASGASGGSALRKAGIIHSAASAGSNVMGIKPSIERSGAIGGAAGMLATQTPYLVFTRPRIAHPEDQNKYTGYPSFMTQELSELSGFTQIQAIHLEGLACTANELAELDALLKSGVIF